VDAPGLPVVAPTGLCAPAQVERRASCPSVDLRHSFASLLLHEGRNVIYVARQLGHGPRLTLTVYGHVVEELDGAPQIEAASAIQAAREAHVRVSFAPPLAAAT